MHKTSWLAVLFSILSLASAARAQESKAPETQPRLIEVATLGIKTRPPSEKEAEQRSLETEVRVRGRIVTDVEKQESAGGIAAGDVLVKLDKNELFSDDDIADFLAVSKPGQKVEALVLRATDSKAETLVVTLGARKVEAPVVPQLAWEFASLAQLPDALAKAKKAGKLVLVGLSGVET